MSSAVDRLADELMKLSDDEWDRIVRLRSAAREADAAPEVGAGDTAAGEEETMSDILS